MKRWRDGAMRHRWCTCGLLRAEQGFRRVKGHRDLANLIKALTALVDADQAALDKEREAA